MNNVVVGVNDSGVVYLFSVSFVVRHYMVTHDNEEDISRRGRLGHFHHRNSCLLQLPSSYMLYFQTPEKEKRNRWAFLPPLKRKDRMFFSDFMLWGGHVGDYLLSMNTGLSMHAYHSSLSLPYTLLHPRRWVRRGPVWQC